MLRNHKEIIQSQFLYKPSNVHQHPKHHQEEPLNLAEATLPVYTVYRMFCLTPIVLRKTKYSNQQRNFTPSKLRLTYIVRQLMILTVSLAPFPFDKSSIFGGGTHEGSIMKPLNYTLEVVFLPVIIIYSMINNARRQRQICDVFKDLEAIDDVLRDVGLKITYGQIRRYARKELLCLLLITGVKFVFRIINNYETWNIFLRIISYDVHDLMLWLVMSQFFNMVYLLKQRLYYINLSLKTFRQVPRAPDRASCLSKLRAVYDRLYAHGTTVNGVFSMQILLVTAANFQNLLSECYYMYKLVSGNWSWDDVRQLMFMMKWVSSNMALMLLLSSRCSGLAAEAEATASLLHRLDFQMYDFAVLKEIEMFSLQLLHQKFSFSAAGFFKIDSTLVYNIVGTVAVYLIVLIQFDRAGIN